MGIIHGNIFKHSLRVCHFVAINNLGSTTVRFCDNGRARISDHVYFYGDLDSSLVSVATYVQLDCFEEINIDTSVRGTRQTKADETLFTGIKGIKGMCKRMGKPEGKTIVERR